MSWSKSLSRKRRKVQPQSEARVPRMPAAKERSTFIASSTGMYRPREDGRDVRERIRVAEEIRALAVPVRLAPERIQLESVAAGNAALQNERVHRPSPPFGLRTGEREVGRFCSSKNGIWSGPERSVRSRCGIHGQVQKPPPMPNRH